METKELLTIVLSCVLGSSGVFGFIFWSITRSFLKRDAQKEEERKKCEQVERERQETVAEKDRALYDRLGLIESGTKAMLHDRLYQATSYHLSKGYCTPTDKMNLDTMVKPYLAMGMNGAIKAQAEDCLRLPNEPIKRKPVERKNNASD